jgi:hypothetical protein
MEKPHYFLQNGEIKEINLAEDDIPITIRIKKEHLKLKDPFGDAIGDRIFTLQQSAETGLYNFYCTQSGYKVNRGLGSRIFEFGFFSKGDAINYYKNTIYQIYIGAKPFLK